MFILILVIAILTLIGAAQLDDLQMNHKPAEYETGIANDAAWVAFDAEKTRDAQVKPFSGIRVG